MPSLSTVRAFNEKTLGELRSVPVALFVGGTSGIGHGTAEAFARHTKGNAHIILCGRNRAAAERIIATFPTPTAPGAKYEFVQCDVTLMRNVRAATAELVGRLPKLNFLVLSTAQLDFGGRDETEEGIDRKLAIIYYARWKFVYELLPLMKKATSLGEPARMLSVFAAGRAQGTLNPDDLDFKQSYDIAVVRKTAIIYMDIMIESFALAHPDMSFTHTWPGVVRTPLYQFSKLLLRPLNPLVTLLLMPYRSRSSSRGSTRCTLSLLRGAPGPCWRQETAEVLPRPKEEYLTEEVRKMMWEHTVKITRVEE